MKKRYIITSLASIAIAAIATAAMWGQATGSKLKNGNEGPKDSSPKIALAYVVDRYDEIPDPDMFSHLIYAFGVFNDNYDGVVVRYPEKLKALADLKKQNPELKVMLGLNDYRRPGFCEMTGDDKKRKKYVNSVKKIIREYNLDGVDLDWEFPTTEKGGHTASPDDDKNYVKLVRDLRKALGKDKWISYYSNNSGLFIDHKGMLPYVSYVNVSGYNLAIPRAGEDHLLHQSPLYPGEKTGEWCVSKAIERHINKYGIPKEKALMGIPFFGRGLPPFKSETSCCDFDKYANDDLHIVWDDEAQAPYYADKDGNLILGFDDERSIAAKFDFIRANNMPGVFVWSYEGDFDDHRLSKTMQKLRKGK